MGLAVTMSSSSEAAVRAAARGPWPWQVSGWAAAAGSLSLPQLAVPRGSTQLQRIRDLLERGRELPAFTPTNSSPQGWSQEGFNSAGHFIFGFFYFPLHRALGLWMYPNASAIIDSFLANARRSSLQVSDQAVRLKA